MLYSSTYLYYTSVSSYAFRNHTVHNHIPWLVQALLQVPQGVVRLMDLLNDSQEVVRNEALLLMVGLTHASPEIKQFAAFEGAFESLLKIIRQGADSPINSPDGLRQTLVNRKDFFSVQVEQTFLQMETISCAKGEFGDKEAMTCRQS